MGQVGQTSDGSVFLPRIPATNVSKNRRKLSRGGQDEAGDFSLRIDLSPFCPGLLIQEKAGELHSIKDQLDNTL